MSDSVTNRLKDMGLELPATPAAAGKYVPVVQTGNLVFTSGQLPLKDGALVAKGRLGAGVSLEVGQEAAKWCAMNVLAQVKAELGSLDQVKRVVKITVFVASAPEFVEQHLVANGASGLFIDAFGAERGAHARSAVGMASLPLDAAVEVEAVLEIA